MIIPINILEIIATRWPELIIAICAVLITIAICKFIYIRITKLEEKTKHSDCRVNASKIGDIESRSRESDGMIKEVRDAVIAMRTILISKYEIKADALSAKFSPRRLTPLGEQILKDSNGLEYIEANLESLMNSICDMEPQTAYDVEKHAFAVLLSASDTSRFNHFKDYVYKASVIDMGEGRTYEVALSDVCYVMSLPLRDKYLEKHREIDPSDYTNEIK